jgi:TonB family protein
MWRQNRKLTKSSERKRLKKEKLPAGQVVESVPNRRKPLPDDTPFLSRYDSYVERQTKSRYRDSSYRRHLPTPSSTKPKAGEGIVNPLEDFSLVALSKKGVRNRMDDFTEFPRISRRSSLNLQKSKQGRFMNRMWSDELRGDSMRFRLRLGDDDGEKKKGEDESVALLGLGFKSLKEVGGGPFNDYLPDVTEDESTFLNSRQFKYASFFNRIKRDVSQHWHPDVTYRKRDPTGRIYGYKDRLTILKVVLSSDGSLYDISIQKPSGLDFLDQEAVKAFKEAQPFPNPPEGLLDEDGKISFSFGFFFEIHSSPLLWIFRPKSVY